MAVIINLKELFASDAQEIYVDKVNFNFNKLLELGIGQPGPQGITGPLGSAGPQGIQGDDGIRGNKWFVGTGDPNGQTFQDLMIGDFYLETASSSVYQYQGSPATWIQVTDFTSIVNNIISGSVTPFVRGFGEGSPDDDRFITFVRHGNDTVDTTIDVGLGNAANNDTLLLNNWNEKVTAITNFPSNTDDEFNAIQTISVDHTLSKIGRYHLEIGSLYADAKDGDNIKLSSLDYNLKLRYTKISPSSSSAYPTSIDYLNTALFTLSLPDDVGDLSTISEQGLFVFETPLYNNDDLPDQQRFYLRIGTSEAASNFGNLLEKKSTDGIHISNNAKTGMSFGLLRNVPDKFPNINNLFQSSNVPIALLGTDATAGVITNQDISLIGEHQFKQVHEYAPFMSFLGGLGVDGKDGYDGLFMDGRYLMMVAPDGDNNTINDAGAMAIYDVSDIDNPIELFSATSSSFSFVPGPPIGGTDYDIHGNASTFGWPEQRNLMPLTGARDITFAGKYGIFVRRQPDIVSTAPPLGETRRYDTFFVFELDSDHPNPDTPPKIKQVSYMGYSSEFTNLMTGSVYQSDNAALNDILKDLRRVKISGSWAFCITTDRNPLPGTAESYLLAVDITNPARPYINSTYIRTSPSVYHIDFDIQGEMAYTLSVDYNDPADLRLKIEKTSIFEPTTLSTHSYSATEYIESYGLSLFPPDQFKGAIKVHGTRIYAVYNNTLYIYKTDLDPTAGFTLISKTDVSDTDYYLRDIEISNQYAYILCTRGASKEESGTIIFDLTDEANPYEVDKTSLAPSLYAHASRLAMSGNRLFAAAGSTKGGSNILTSELGGVKVPAGKIGHLNSKDIKVSSNVSIGETLQVGRSATIGSGGLWVDTGEGVNVSGTVKSNISHSATGANQEELVCFEGDINGHYNYTGLSSIAGSKISITDISSISPAINAVWGNVISLDGVNLQGALNNAVTPTVAALRINLDNIDLNNGTSQRFAYAIHQTPGAANTSQIMNDFHSPIRNVSGNNQSHGIYFYGYGNNHGKLYDTGLDIDINGEDGPNRHFGQWSIEYLGSISDSDPNKNGLNFWKPWPSYNTGDPNYKLFLADSGNVGINNGDPQCTLDVNGDINASGNITGNFSSSNTNITGGNIEGDTIINTTEDITTTGTISTTGFIGGDTINAATLLSVGGESYVITLSDGSGASNKRHIITRLLNSGVSIDAANVETKGGEVVRDIVDAAEEGVSLDASIAAPGIVKAQGYFASSDRRLKNELVDLTKNDKNTLDILNKLRPVIYDWKKSGMIEIGFFAQDVEEILPDLVVESKSEEYEDQKSLHYQSIIALNTAAIQSLSKENKELKARLAAIEEKIGL